MGEGGRGTETEVKTTLGEVEGSMEMGRILVLFQRTA